MATTSTSRTDRLIGAEEFADYGGWLLDSQFEIQMGGPYLLAHGLGRPVADLATTIGTGPVDVTTRWHLLVSAWRLMEATS
ncbi:MAG: hypothetical protein AAGA90_03180 [Actinomycetota bacterium]